MKLIRYYEDTFEAEQIAARLESNGIAVYVSTGNANLFGRIQSGAMQIGLWAVLDDQYDDAVAFIADNQHQITTGLTAAEIEQLKSVGRQAGSHMLNNLLAGMIGFIALMVFIAWLNLR